ncbi:MAG TPA: ATP-binding protein [Candidatus Methylomirabilis sp.]|nr:ATP-binding protein [Candidatus Methylomirabilis sp.]HSB80965.1 ATP-binding protein [Candidatus Methylomirabilis sp.]
MTKHVTLRTKFILILNLLVVLLVATAAFLAEMQQRNGIIEEVKKRAIILALGLADASANSLVTYNYVGVEQSLTVATGSPDVLFAVVLDKEGNIAASTIRDTPSRAILLSDKAVAATGTDPLIRQLTIPGSNPETVYDVAVPVRIEGSEQRWGTVRLGVSLKSMYQQIDRTRWQIAAFGLIAVLIASLSSFVLAQRITKPLQALTGGVAAVGRGDFGQRIEVTSQDELGQLSSAFNEMTRQLGRIRDLEDRLRRADRLAALGTMAAGIAHDIRNPLTSILIFSQLMSLHHDDPEVREKFDRVVPRELERVQAVIEDMMELARPATLHLEPANLNEVLSQVLELYEGQATAQGIKIARGFEPNLPACTADRKRLHRCFSNLVANAIQAMPDGGDLTIRTNLADAAVLVTHAAGSPGEPAVCVTIADTGQGIPPDRLSRIFDPFYTTKEKGLGLGMAITHRIVEDHKGTIDVQSQVGLGTTFTVHLPVNS